jgi:hypothetical protein
MPTPHDPNGAAAPDITPTDIPAAEVPAPAAATPEGQETPPAPVEPVDQEAAAIAAFDKGVKEVGGATAEPAAEPRTAADVAAAAAATVEATSMTAAPPAAAGAPLVVDHGATPPAAPAAPDKDPETDAAVTELGLKGKAETRFREMAGTIKTQAQELEPLRADAERGRRWEEMVLNTKAPPEQFGNALGYLAAVNSGDPAQMNKAFDTMVNELGWLAQQLGRELPGVVDPLAAHQDLAQEVQNGYITKDRALELARVRATDARRTEADQRNKQEDEQKRVYDQSMSDVAALNNKLKAEDPDFDRKFQLLLPTLDVIRNNTPPAQWVDAIQRAWKLVPALPPIAPPPAAPVRPRVGAMPVRPTGASQSMQRQPKSDIEAFDMGVASVSR